MLSPLILSLEAEATARGAKQTAAQQLRLRELFGAHADLVWRLIRRQGLTADQADDGLQQVFMVALRRLDSIKRGSERSFLCSTAILVARELTRHREDLPGELPDRPDEGDPEDSLEQKQQRALLQRVLDQLEEELRWVLVLQDIEGLSKRECAEVLEVPEGTVASRTRRARERFRELLAQEARER
ncbi:MAG: sigma-70 family RNA polymerase sigma factor [Myxococcaceae bacterium]|nr:sigma-70 family RNA polymerase sigma factor [Myxococcaceae bacterium]